MNQKSKYLNFVIKKMLIYINNFLISIKPFFRVIHSNKITEIEQTNTHSLFLHILFYLNFHLKLRQKYYKFLIYAKFIENIVSKSFKFKQSGNELFPKKEKFHQIYLVFIPFCLTLSIHLLYKNNILAKSFHFKILYNIIFIL